MTKVAVDTVLPVCQNARMPHVGEVVRRLRKERDWTLDDLASHSNLNKGTISELERGESNPTVATLTAISKALNLHNYRSLFSILEDADPQQAAQRREAAHKAAEDGFLARYGPESSVASTRDLARAIAKRFLEIEATDRARLTNAMETISELDKLDQLVLIRTISGLLRLDTPDRVVALRVIEALPRKTVDDSARPESKIGLQGEEVESNERPGKRRG